MYWTYGGSTVVTDKFVRLTQDTQDRQGWLWNDYPLESDFWEVQFEIEIFSTPNYGGDGMCMWILNSDMDPSFDDSGRGLSGPILGMRTDFKGLGVCIDVYDNDHRRNNPTFFVIENKGDKTFNHNNDFEDDMNQAHPIMNALNFMRGDAKKTSETHKCVVEIRNSGKAYKILAKYLHSMLHVYIDNRQGKGWKFCLVVQLNQTYNDYHIAFSAATGQVADVHDIHKVTVRYLESYDKDTDDSLMDSYGTSGRTRTWSNFFFNVLSLLNFGLFGYSIHQLLAYRKLTTARIDIVNVMRDLNKHVEIHFIGQALVAFLCLCTLNWILFLFHVPIGMFRAFLFLNGEMHFSEGAVTGEGQKGHDATGVPAKVRIGVNLFMYFCCSAYCLYYFF